MAKTREIILDRTELLRTVSNAGTQWQNQIIDIFRIPSVAKVWKELNPRWPDLGIERVPGSVSEYLLRYGKDWYWNSYKSAHVRNVWDGIRRETHHEFALSILSIARSYINGSEPDLRGAKLDNLVIVIRYC